MDDHTLETPALPSFKKAFLGIQGFLFFTALGVILAICWKAPASFRILWEHTHPLFLLILVPLVGLDYLLGGLRFRLFFDGRILPDISLWNCMRSNLANIFMAAITPGQTGGGPAQLYILWRCGAKVSQAALISLVNFAATLLFFLIASLISWALLPSHLWGENFVPIMQTGLLVLATMISLVLLVIMFPSLGLVLVKQLFRVVPVRLLRLESFRDRLLATLNLEIQHFRQIFREILQARKMVLLVTVLVTVALYSNKYLMAYVIARALDQPVPFGIFFGLQIIQYVLIYFAPTPGASGLAEISSSWLMNPLMSAQVLVYYAVVWRFFTTFLGAFLGGYIFFLDLRSWVKKPASVKKDKDIVESQLLASRVENGKPDRRA